MKRLQGLPPAYELPALTKKARAEVVGNAVPLVMGRAIAAAVQGALDARERGAA